MSKKTDRVLSVSMRPEKLDDMIGMDETISTIKSQLTCGRVPHFFLIVGPTGSGKTTIARIIALMLQFKNHEINYEIVNKLDITEINASDKNGIDDVRNIIEMTRYKPLSPSIAKVFIMDEAHQLTTQAQNTLLKETEEACKHVYFIFCTSAENKIIPTLQRRAYIIKTSGIDKESIHKLLTIAKEKAGFTESIDELKDALIENDINYPGLVLQSAEKYFNGSDIKECIYNISGTTIDTKKLCSSLSKGDWKNVAVFLKEIKKEEIVMLRLCILGYFKTIILNSGDLGIAKAIKVISEECYELPTFIANLCIACSIIFELKASKAKAKAALAETSSTEEEVKVTKLKSKAVAAATVVEEPKVKKTTRTKVIKEDSE